VSSGFSTMWMMKKKELRLHPSWKIQLQMEEEEEDVSEADGASYESALLG